MREIVDHFFPPVGLLVPAGGEAYTDFNYWRDPPLDIEDFTDSEDDDDDRDDDRRTEAASIRSEDEGSEVGEDLEASYMSRDSLDETGMEDSVVESIEGGDYAEGEEYVDERDTDDEESEVEGEVDEGSTPTREQLLDIDSPVERMRGLSVGESTPTPRASPRR
jgi:phosphatidate phosphatase LPIN